MDDMQPVADRNVGPHREWSSGFEQEPPLGAHLTTPRRGYNHHGEYVGRGRVVHYAGLSGFWQCAPVEFECSVPCFTRNGCGGFCNWRHIHRAQALAVEPTS